jgi:hypothetical protein
MSSAEAVSALNGLGQSLRDEYPRPALSGRIEQIDKAAANLKSLLEQLPDEEEREADYAERLLALHDAGFYERERHSQAAHERLEHALSARNGGAE